MTPPLILHATTIALRQQGRWRGVTLRGPSGVGKSELAWRALAVGWRLVADDRTLVWRSGGRLYAKPPHSLAGLIEARGQGVLSQAALSWVELVLAVDLASEVAALERVPPPRTTMILDTPLPCIALFPGDGSAIARLSAVLAAQRSGL